MATFPARTRFAAGSLLFSFLLAAAGVAGRAQAAPKAAGSERELAVVIVESLARGPGRITDFDRMKMEFTDVFGRRNWPVKIRVERFAANTPAHETELRVFFQGIYDEAPGDLTFHAWMILYDHGVKRDFGVIRYRYNPRPGQPEEDVLEHVMRGAAEVAAAKIESALFGRPDVQKH
jgi:hypothetical protein